MPGIFKCCPYCRFMTSVNFTVTFCTNRSVKFIWCHHSFCALFAPFPITLFFTEYRKEFWWFDHLWNHLQPHKVNLSTLVDLMQQNKRFAEVSVNARLTQLNFGCEIIRLWGCQQIVFDEKYTPCNAQKTSRLLISTLFSFFRFIVLCQVFPTLNPPKLSYMIFLCDPVSYPNCESEMILNIILLNATLNTKNRFSNSNIKASWRD